MPSTASKERYKQIHVTDLSPEPGASRRAAVVQAAFASLAALFPSQSDALNLDRAASLAAIADEHAIENSQSIARGLAWGQLVAEEIIAWRNADGLSTAPSTYVGPIPQQIGKWRPTPRPPATPGGPELAGLTGAFPSLATTTPFVIPSPSSFRSTTGPPALTSDQYAADFIEVKLVGEAGSLARTADQTVAARFWGGTALAFWNRAAASASRERHLTLSENARLFALLNIAITDAVISCWDAKYLLRVLAAHHRDPARRHGWQPSHDPAVELDAAAYDAQLSRIRFGSPEQFRPGGVRSDSLFRQRDAG